MQLAPPILAHRVITWNPFRILLPLQSLCCDQFWTVFSPLFFLSLSLSEPNLLSAPYLLLCELRLIIPVIASFHHHLPFLFLSHTFFHSVTSIFLPSSYVNLNLFCCLESSPLSPCLQPCLLMSLGQYSNDNEALWTDQTNMWTDTAVFVCEWPSNTSIMSGSPTFFGGWWWKPPRAVFLN